MSVRSVRDILINLLGRETISDAAGKADRGLGKLDDRMKATADDAKKLDGEIDKAERGLRDLATQYARTGDAAERLDLTKAMRRQQAELRRLTRARGLLDPDLLDDDADQAGQSAGRRIVRGLREQLGGTELKRAGIGAGGAVATGLVAGLLAGAGGAVLSVGVAGAVAGGVVLAARDSRVQAAGKELGSAVLGDLEDTVGARFVGPTLDGIGIVRQGWRDVRGDIDGAARAAAKFVAPISRGMVGLVREFAPRFREALENAGPVVLQLERGLTGLGRTLGNLFANLDPESAAAGLKFLFTVIDVGVEVVGGLINAFGDLYLSMIDTKLAAAETGETLLGWAPLFGDDLKEIAERLRVQREELRQGGEAGEEAGDRIFQGLNRAGDAAEESGRQIQSWADIVRESTDRAYQHEMAGIRAAEAMHRLGEAAKEGAGKGIDNSTEASRRNRTELINAARAAMENAQSMRDVEGDHQGAAEATRRARAEFLRAAAAMGAEKGEAEALANSLFRIPNVDRKVTVDTSGARSQVNAYKRWLASVNLDKRSTVYQRIVAERNTARGGNREFMSAGGYVDGPGAKGVDSVPAVLAPGEGVLSAPEMDRIGGRSGFERLRKVIATGGGAGSAMAPAAAGHASGAAQPATVVLELRSGGTALDDLLVEILRRSVKRLGGGNVQLALGR